MSRTRGTVAVVALTLALVPAAAVAKPPRPLAYDTQIGDPSVAATADGHVVVATGHLTPRLVSPGLHRWRSTRPALRRLPEWAKRGELWAADIARVEGRWLLYFSARVRGLTDTSRCIGVAVAPRPTAVFRVVTKNRPLVCPSTARVPLAEDPIADGPPTQIGAIDPSLFVDRGRRYLLYKTDGIPSSVRIVELTAKGRRVAPGAVSRALVMSGSVIENPVLVRRKRGFYLFTSAGDYSRCSYATEWRRSDDLLVWPDLPPTPVLTQSTTGLCGPGGADILLRGLRATMFFAAWVHHGTSKPIRGSRFRAFRNGPRAERAMYAARLVFPGGVPTIRSFLRPR